MRAYLPLIFRNQQPPSVIHAERSQPWLAPLSFPVTRRPSLSSDAEIAGPFLVSQVVLLTNSGRRGILSIACCDSRRGRGCEIGPQVGRTDPKARWGFPSTQ